MDRYYKLYMLEDSKLISKFGRHDYIELNRKYSAEALPNKICFAKINQILDYVDDHGDVVCDVEPVGKVADYSEESECECIIARNPRSIYSPEFIEEVIEFGEKEAWRIISDESYVTRAIAHCNDGMCYEKCIDYERGCSLRLLLIESYNNEELNKLFQYKRPRFDYNSIYNMTKNDKESKKVVVAAWNKYAPCTKSRFLKLFILFV